MLKRIKQISFIIWVLFSQGLMGQISVSKQDMHITYDALNQELIINQKLQIVNRLHQKVDTIYWLNWANAYTNKNTKLAKRFIENYDLSFHFAREKNRGKVKIHSLLINNQLGNIQNLESDIYYSVLDKPLKINDSIQTTINYRVKLPNRKFTGYGIDNHQNMELRNFYFHPIAFPYQKYCDKNIDNYPEFPTRFYIQLKGFPTKKDIYSNLHIQDNRLSGKLINPIIIFTNQRYDTYIINGKKICIAHQNDKINKVSKQFLLNKIMSYLKDNLGEYPYDKILISLNDLKQNKVYGPDLLPGFINPYTDELLWESEILHQLSLKYAQCLQTDKRKYPWLSFGIAGFTEYEYIEKNYPDLKLLGNLEQYRIARLYYASQVKMNEKYPWLYLYMARMNQDQKLTTPLDVLSNFNRKVASPSKAGLGLVMLRDMYAEKVFENKLKKFFQTGTQTFITDDDFYRTFAHQNNARWFRKYISSRDRYDYKIKPIKTRNDSIEIRIQNKTGNQIPATLYGIRNDSIVYEKKLPQIANDTLIKIPKSTRLTMAGINYFNNYPEIQNHNNFKKVNHFIFNRPIQARLYQDFDNPMKQQIFVNPYFEYNYYDGVILGGQIYNESFLHNNFFYSVSPSYATKSDKLTGSISASYNQYFSNFKPYAVKYGFNYKYFHYDNDLAYRRLNPYVEIKLRKPNLRKRKGENLLFQFMYIDKDPKGLVQTENENYKVFDIKYKIFDVNVIKDFYLNTDLQFSEKFGKISAMARYRFLSNQNRQWDFRIFAGAFFYNQTHSHYFSFALDRPTDYLFQYNYYGRSETSGIFHQQFVWAEGGFKSFFDDQYANSFIISNNVNIGIWKWFNLYGDFAWKKNKKLPVRFFYDSGVRINLVQDYFEVFFPVYSGLGFEPQQDKYYQKIRMVFTIDINGLFKMVRRGWY